MHPLKLAQLRFFCAVVEEGSVAAAARRLNCVASNVTTRLRELEQSLGEELFQRERGRLLLSPTGRIFYREALPVVASAARLARLFDDAGQPRGLLRIGALDVALDGFLTRHLPGFIAAHPGIEFSLLRRPSYVLERMLADGEIDLALTDGPIAHPLLDGRAAFAEDLCIVTAAAIGDLSAVDWSSAQVFLFDTDCFYRDLFTRWLNTHELRPAGIQTIESYDLIAACVRAGLGVSCVPATMIPARNAREGLAIHRPDDLGPSEVHFVWRSEAPERSLLLLVDWLTSRPD
ncbi:DNA-binding transcriptional LysR family regulator [Endobacter medicaginis]|uniref:DNA-binding transcriptional LysR family regulator n=3 Tax=Endobacter medicaginis TaxID=1181271 RepID=A0A839V1E4_9PROT|nr:LysR family transcriptional regulator [Endobacter medicaginis]MBB3174503.1 DNA-binding transcriptional LysR family regulator [Endobacter medicaginis]MCX5475048.1 LysR family transcriptional regulator [Endobacter medicaginis]